MPLDISEIRAIRKNLGLTQSQLANLAGVSQSLIAKIEAGIIDPTYSNAVKIFNALESFNKEKEVKAKDIMTQKIISLAPNESIKEAIQKMKKYEISQMPVIAEGKAVGSISESILLDSVIENKRAEKVSDVMEDAPPIVSKDSSIKIVSDMLKYFPMVLIGEKGRLIGIITKSDLLRRVFSK
ncbi:MAG: CBS domain-containing protein [Candidatus Woesearchaeota archaeon]|nr:CBS domain-containing protein [Candidatus Woesearchaeota archaeon]